MPVNGATVHGDVFHGVAQVDVDTYSPWLDAPLAFPPQNASSDDAHRAHNEIFVFTMVTVGVSPMLEVIV